MTRTRNWLINHLLDLEVNGQGQRTPTLVGERSFHMMCRYTKYEEIMSIDNKMRRKAQLDTTTEAKPLRGHTIKT